MNDQGKKVAIHGAAGRMGSRLVALTLESADLQLAAALDAPSHPAVGRDAGEIAGAGTAGVALAGEWPGDTAVEVLIDFTLPQGTRRIVPMCVERGVPLVVGTTGLTAEDEAMLDEAAASIPVLKATNFSLVVNVLNVLAAQAAKMLNDDYDIEILEAHHRFKKDAPSGTALTLAQHICQATGRDFDKDVVYCRHGDNVTRQPREITVQALRIGDHVGEHTAYFAALGERLELKHVSTNRDSYVRGALHAARWLVRQPAGRYDMTNVLGLSNNA